ncbi:hypothetical protein DL95DRAFT_123048 [Leptodontidium sp. 2 PMI_412]|nr:hypothetical protein DL95DRAFT_123048 [Leptodontidium sp. 2 PMI_412]
MSSSLSSFFFMTVTAALGMINSTIKSFVLVWPLLFPLLALYIIIIVVGLLYFLLYFLLPYSHLLTFPLFPLTYLDFKAAC